jgi:hypothetical protein
LVTIPIGLVNFLQVPTFDWINISSKNHLSKAVVIHPLQTGPLHGRVHIRPFVFMVYRRIKFRFQVGTRDLYLVLEYFRLFYHIYLLIQICLKYSYKMAITLINYPYYKRYIVAVFGQGSLFLAILAFVTVFFPFLSNSFSDNNKIYTTYYEKPIIEI